MIFRRKLRYLLVEASESINLSIPATQTELKRELQAFMGHLPCFKANPQVAAQLSEKVFIISLNRGCERGVALALAFTKHLENKRVGFYTIRTSGTIRSVKEHFEKNYL